MTNLSDKFGSFEEQVAAQHAELLTEMRLTNAKLDALIAALGGAPPTATITLADVVEKLEEQRLILSDVHLDTMSMDQKLLRIRDAIWPLDMTMPPGDDNTIPWLLYRLVDAINPTWPRPTSVPAQPALSALLQLAQLQLPQLTEIQEALGTPSGDASTTALGYLSSIQYSNAGIYQSTGASAGSPNTILELLAANADAGCGCASPNAMPTGCAAPFRSTAMAILPAGIVPGADSLILARWSTPLPAGVSFGTVFGLSNNDSELHRDSWDGWRMYVASDQSQFALNPLGLERYPTNTWLDVPALGAPSQGSGNIAFSVQEHGALTVTLCPAGQSTSEECMEMSTIFIPDEGCYFSQWPTGWGTQNGYGTGHWLHAELSGYKIWSDDPTGFKVIYSPNVDNSGYSSAALPGAGVDNAFVLPSGTKSVSLNSSSAFGGDSSAFLFWICPPPGGVLPPSSLPE